MGALQPLPLEDFGVTVEVLNDQPYNYDYVLFYQGGPGRACIDGFCVSALAFEYTDSTGTALDDDSLAGTVGLSVDDFDNLANGRPVRRSSFLMRFGNTVDGKILGLPTGLNVAVVDTIVTPLPPTAWLVWTGLGVLAAARLRRRRGVGAGKGHGDAEPRPGHSG